MSDGALPLKGDWVQVWALVTDADPHPEEYAVRLESHNEHYTGLVRRDHVVVTEEMPDFVERCFSLHDVRVMMPGPEGAREEQALVRCTKTHEHSGVHRNGRHQWDDRDSAGSIEV